MVLVHCISTSLCISLQIRCYSLLQPSAKIFFFVDELLSIRSASSLKSCTGHNECKYFHLNVSLSLATFRVILERLYSSQTVYAPWVLEVLLQWVRVHDCTTVCTGNFEEVKLLLLKKWIFENKVQLRGRWPTHMQNLRASKLVSWGRYSTQSACFFLHCFGVSCFKMPPPKHRINIFKSQQRKDAMAAVSTKRWNDFSWFH